MLYISELSNKFDLNRTTRVSHRRHLPNAKSDSCVNEPLYNFFLRNSLVGENKLDSLFLVSF